MSEIVLGEGPRNALIMLIGQNPGNEEVKIGRPFVGRSGKYLDGVLRKNGLIRSQIYITSVVKEGTPGNRRPTPQEIKRWLPHLIGEIKEIRPKIVALMGAVAWQIPRFEGIKYIETYHPAAAMRFPEMRKKFEADIRELKSLVIRYNKKND